MTNPNNPVGTILTEPEMNAIVAAARKVGAWILADEVYRGTELHTDDITPSFWGRYDRVVCVGSMSKAFGLPGLRLGWLVGPPEFVEQVRPSVVVGIWEALWTLKVVGQRVLRIGVLVGPP